MAFKNHRAKIRAYRASGKMFGQAFNPGGLNQGGTQVYICSICGVRSNASICSSPRCQEVMAEKYRYDHNFPESEADNDQ